MDDLQARGVLLEAFAARGIAPGLTEIQAVQAVARGESNYGAARGHNNWGSIQCKHGPPCVEGECFELTDHHGDGTPYQWCYRSWPTPLAGAAAFVANLYGRKDVPAALRSGSAAAVAGAMAASGYFELGVGQYATGIAFNAKAIAKALGEPLAVTIEGPAPQPKPLGGPTLAAWGAVAAIAIGLVWLAQRGIGERATA